MSAINLNHLFHDLTTDRAFLSVCIPQIQRDYAEGRETDSVEKKRINMLSDMLEVVLQNKKLSLDFVYGNINIKEHTFMPLDGQQRLTTLFLLHWLLGRNDDLKDSLGHSLFVYQTRKTSEEFCHWLVKQESKVILEKWHQEVIEAEKTNANNERLWNTSDVNGKIDKIANRLKYPLVHVPTLSDYFMEMDDFKWDWHIDPNIRSMIVVMETAYRIIQQQGATLDQVVSQNKNLDNITFEILKDLNCDGDELFEKMNARGKALSTYDLLKSSLEEELEIQKSSLSNNRDWQEKIDNEWLYYCWDSSNIPVDPTLEDVKRVEDKLETLLLRMIGKTFFKQNIIYKKPDDGKEVPGQSLEACIYKDCDNVAENYFKYARFERRKKSFSTSSFSQLNLQEVYDDLNNLIYKDTDGTYKDIARYLHDNGLKMHSAKHNTLLDDFTSDSLGHETRVIFYAMMAYLKNVNATMLVKNPIEFANFKDWMRFARNVFTAANKNVRIDKPDLVKSAISAIDKWLNTFFVCHHKGAYNNEMLHYIANVIVFNANGQEQARLEEEAIKANLRLGINTNDNSKDWEIAIIDSENDPYLWGQIIAPLKWSEKNGLYDLRTFKEYVDKLSTLIRDSWKDEGQRLIQACLCLKDYRFNGNKTWGSLGILNPMDRDISWKRHLRDSNTNGIYGELLKQLIEVWMNQYNTLTCDQFLSKFIVANTSLIKDWRKYICLLPHTKLQTLFNHVGTSKRYVNLDSGNIYIYRSTQNRSDAVRYELFTLYLYFSVASSIQNKEVKQVNDGAYLELTTNSGIIRITSKTNNLYDVDDHCNTSLNNVTDADVINKLSQLGVI